PLLVAGYWVKDGVRGPVGGIAAPLLPAFVSASSASGEQYRQLILRPGCARAVPHAEPAPRRRGTRLPGRPAGRPDPRRAGARRRRGGRRGAEPAGRRPPRPRRGGRGRPWAAPRLVRDQVGAAAQPG